MLIRKAYRYRLYPNKAQVEALSKNFGCARFVYNFFLAERKRYYDEHKADPEKRGLTYSDTANQLRDLKRDAGHLWLKEAHSQVLQQSLMDLDRAYQNFFDQRAGSPGFHKKSGKQTIRYPQGTSVGDNWVSLPKIGRIKAVIHRPYDCKIKHVSVTKPSPGAILPACRLKSKCLILVGQTVPQWG